MANPTIVVANLDDTKLKESIDKMVKNLDEQLLNMMQSTDTAVKYMQKSLQSVGNVKFGGDDDGGSTRRTKKLQEEENSVNRLSSNYDQLSASMQKTSRSESPTQTMQTQLELMIERLRAARSQYSSFIELAEHATTTGDKGLFQFATENVHRYEQEVHDLIPQIRNMRDAISQMGNVLAPQGHTIQNYVNSLQKANPELAQLNESFKRGQSLMQNGITTTQQLANAQEKSNTSTNQSKQALDDMNAYIRQNIQREQERRDAIRQTGLAARETADQLIRSAHEQASAHGNSPITGTKELAVAIEQMRRAYFDMSALEKMSPIGIALEADIKRANDAIAVIRKYNQSLLGSQQNDANKITNASTLNSLRESLRNLTEQYNRLTVAEINAGKGDALIQHFQDTTRAAQILQKTLNRPVSLKSALSGDERTLDDIAYKMRMLQSYRGGLDITKPNQKAELEQINYELTRLQKKQQEILGQDKAMVGVNNALARSWNYMKNRLAFYFTVGASTQFVKNLIEIRSQYEMNERALGILIDSAERGSKIFNELSSMALVSPYTLIELSSAAKQLTAYDVAAKDVVDTTRRLADMTAAVGIPIERLTYALGQIKAYGYLNSRDARMFSNAGIPLVKELSKYYTELEGRLVSVGDVYDRMKKKTIEYNDVMNVMYKMTDEGGKFFDFQAKMADTLKVQLANLTLAWNNMLNDIGESNQSMIAGGIGALKELFLHWQQINKIVNDLVVVIGSLAASYVMLNIVFGKSTAKAIARAVAMQKVSQADAQAILSSKNLSVSQLKLLVSLNRTNKEFIATIANLKRLSMSEITAAMKASALKTAWYAVAASARLAATAVATLADALLAIAPQMAIFAVTMAIVDLIQTFNEGSEKAKELNHSIVENAKESAKAIKETIDSLKESGVTKDSVSILSLEEQKKAWDEIRERIELSSAASEKFIAALMQETNLSKRVALGLGFLEEIEKAHDIMSLWHEDAIEVSEDFKILGIGADGLTEDLSDFVKYMNKASDSAGELMEKSSSAEGTWRQILSWAYDLMSLTPSAWMKDEADNMGIDILSLDKAKFTDAYKEVQSEIEKTYKSLYKQLEKDGVDNANTVYEIISKTISNIATERKWSEQETLTARLLLEQRFATSDVDIFRKSVADKNTAWDAWMNYLTKMHKTEFSNMANEEITEESWAQDKRKKLYEETFEKFKEYNALAYDLLKDSVNKANLLQVHIKVFYDNQNTLSDVEQDFRARTGYLENSEYYNDFAKGAKSQVEIVDKVKKAQKEKAKEVETAEKAGKEYSEKNLDRLKKENEELITIIHSYGALTDAEEKAQNSNKNKKDILGEAFKNEVEIIQNIQKRYKEYRKEGVSAQDAISKATEEYGRTLIRVNSTLNKYGVKTKKSDELANMDMRSLRSYYMSLLDMASALGNAKGVEALEKAIAGLNVEITKVDYKTILDGLNNQLNKLKEEYELGIELDANPELGDVFSDMFKINRSTLPKDIYDYVRILQDGVNEALSKSPSKLNTFDIIKVDVDKWANENGVEVGSNLYKAVEAAQKQARSAMKSYVTDVNKQTKDLQYKLADTNGKIAIEEEKLARLQQQLGNETHDEKKRLLELQIQEEENTIDKLKEEVLQLLPTYVNLFNSIAEHSDAVTRKLALQWKKALENAVPNGNKYTVTDPISGQQSTISKEQLGKQLDKVNQKLRSTQTSFNKIRESLTKGEDGIVDWAKGIEQISDELKKMSELTSVIGDIAEALGNKNDFNETAEVLHDIANTMAGIAEAGDGIAKISAGDYIGGTTSLLKGTWTAISSWLDNDNKKIDAQIKSSERAVKRLELAYIDLEHAINDAYGVATIGAKRAAIANKELQLVELKRQLTLEQSRDSKDRDDDRIIELQKEIKELQYDIKEATDEIVNDLLGISSVGDAMESMMDNFIEALRNGEDAMKVFDESVNDMIANMVKKMYVTKILQPWFENAWNQVQEDVENRTKGFITLVNNLMNSMGVDDPEGAILKSLEGIDYDPKEWIESLRALRFISEDIYSQIDTSSVESIAKSMANLYKSGGITLDDIKRYASILRDGRDAIGLEMEGLEDFLRELDLMNDPTKELSALQRGISGITEDTANSIEAYLNGVSQQVYLHSDLLTQIRDTVVSFDFDVQLGVMSQMLMHLQNSYQTQQAIQRILEGVLTPSGRAFAVEMN